MPAAGNHCIILAAECTLIWAQGTDLGLDPSVNCCQQTQYLQRPSAWILSCLSYPSLLWAAALLGQHLTLDMTAEPLQSLQYSMNVCLH